MTASEGEEEEIRVLSLTEGTDGERILYRLKLGWTLQFRLGPKLFGKTVDLWTNLPEKDDEPFERSKYRLMKWLSAKSSRIDDDYYIDVRLTRPGSFNYELKIKDKVCGGGYFLVDPELRYGPENEKVLNLNGIKCQTVIAKNLGAFETWDDKLKVSIEAGYNLIHFTPVHVLGESNSAYSLADQHNLNPEFGTNWAELEAYLKKLKAENGVLSICDIVLNHTAAQNSAWIRKDPRITFNLGNCPHLKPAFLLDRIVSKISSDIETGRWIFKGIPKATVSTDEHLKIIKGLLYDHYLPQVNLHEFYQLNVVATVKAFAEHTLDSSAETGEKLEIITDPEFKRLGGTVDLNLANSLYGGKDKAAFKSKLFELNRKAEERTWNHLHCAIDNILKGARYRRVADEGPKVKYCGVKEPLVTQYFRCPLKKGSLAEDEKVMYDPESNIKCMVHNGWVMNFDPIRDKDFVLPGSDVLLRRELVAWGDSVKLNYGSKFEDSPMLWQYMTEYVETVSRVFDGIRLDNCHSTPIHVAEYLMDVARRINPRLYVIAELFTRSEASDNVFINRLGINSLIRENLQAYDSHELGRLIHRFGGDKHPVGSFNQLKYRPLVPSMAHALLFEQTHDNQSIIEKRSAEDTLASAALIAMARCATGATRGSDEFVPHRIHVVTELRSYAPLREIENKSMISAKKVLNDLHTKLIAEGFSEIFVDQIDPDIVAITRHNPKIHESVILISHTAFSHNNVGNRKNYIKPIHVEGDLIGVMFEGDVVDRTKDTGKYRRNEEVINGLPNKIVRVRQNLDIQESKMANLDGLDIHLKTENFLPGSIIAFHFKLQPKGREATTNLRSMVASLKSDLRPIVQELSLKDLNVALFRCKEEESRSLYVLNGYGELPYAGLQGVVNILNDIRAKNDLGNWLPSNLREGDWLMDYIVNRLKGNLAPLGSFLQKRFKELRNVPRYLIPKYFDTLIRNVYDILVNRTLEQMPSEFIHHSKSDFIKALALGSVIHGGVVESSPLPPAKYAHETSLAAGLPHFSTGYMRNWGRDTFISLRGFFLLTGRFEEAKVIILSYGSCLRHGLIPNLLDGGNNSRFNCRDAIWWWLQAVKDYCILSEERDFLKKAIVSRIFPTDNFEEYQKNKEPKDQVLEDVIFEALSKHFTGLKFREWKAGSRIDAHMKDNGFNNEIGVDKETGFVFGGNQDNCGTWMDKMGSSDKAGNRGKPSTPRDGSAVELIGLSYSAITWLDEMNRNDLFSHNSVTNGELTWTWREWAERIKANFESKYFVGSKSESKLVNKVGIYKDTLGSQLPWSDYQLRCNFPIAMALAPNLFNEEHARTALETVKNRLLGPLGVATLDPEDWAYRGDYDNGNDSNDPSVAHGSNYHQGPEWVWPVGFFLRAYLHFWNGSEEARTFVKSVLSAHYLEIKKSRWKGIPELTNSKGKFCPGSNPIQAWSMACLLEVLYDM